MKSFAKVKQFPRADLEPPFLSNRDDGSESAADNFFHFPIPFYHWFVKL